MSSQKSSSGGGSSSWADDEVTEQSKQADSASQSPSSPARASTARPPRTYAADPYADTAPAAASTPPLAVSASLAVDTPVTSTTAQAAAAATDPEQATSAASSSSAAVASSSAAATATATETTKKPDIDLDRETARMERLLVLKPESQSQKHARLRVVQADPNCRLSSIKSFGELLLKPELQRAIAAMGFEKPSAIQEVSLPLMLRDPPENLIAQAQSGSGKTVAFCLGVLNRIDTTQHYPQAIILTPTRELAVQCAQQTLAPLGQFLQPPLGVRRCLPGENVGRGEKITEQVVVATPGKLEDWLKRGTLSGRTIKLFVLDEADSMIAQGQMGFGAHCKRIVKYLTARPQSLLFSATFPPDVLELAKAIITMPINEITLASTEELVLEEIHQYYIDLRLDPPSARIELIQDVYELLTLGQSIVFCRTRKGCDSVTKALQDVGFGVSNLHGDLKGEERDQCMEEFRLGNKKVLITTNVLARGVDIPAVSLVVNYDMPTKEYSQDPDYATYLHRIGRTGRFGRRGVALNLIESNQSFDIMKAIEQHYRPTQTMIHEAPKDAEELETLLSKDMR